MKKLLIGLAALACLLGAAACDIVTTETVRPPSSSVESGSGNGGGNSWSSDQCDRGEHAWEYRDEDYLRWDEKRTEPTCTESAWKPYYVCWACDAYSLDRVTTVTENDLIVPALGHDYEEFWDWDWESDTHRLVNRCQREHCYEDDSYVVLVESEPHKWYYVEEGYPPKVCADCMINAISGAKIVDGVYYTLSKDQTYYQVAGQMNDEKHITIQSTVAGLPVKEILGFAAQWEGENGEPPYVPAFETVDIPDSVTTIRQSAFSRCTNLKSITVPNTVTRLEVYAFHGCANLQTVVFEEGSTLTSLGCAPADANDASLYGAGKTFKDCEKLQSITIPKSVERIEEHTFSGCTELEEVLFEDGSALAAIEKRAFSDCTALNNVILPDKVTELAAYAFDGCTALTSVRIGKGLANIGANVFYDCTNLVEVKLVNEDTSYAANAFVNCSANLTVDVYIEYFEYNNGYYGLKGSQVIFFNVVDKTADYIVLKEGTTKIASNALQGCANLRLIYIPASCQEYEENALANSLPNTFTIFHENRIGDSVLSTFEGDFEGGKAQLPHLKVESAKLSEDGFIYAGSTLWGYVGDEKEVVVPDSLERGYAVEVIAGYAFADTKIDSITLPGCVKAVGGSIQRNTVVEGNENAVVLYPYTPFLGSTVKSVTFGDYLEEGMFNQLAIHSNAFAKAEYLETVTFSSHFENDELLPGYVIPVEAVYVTIVTNAFLDCPSLKKVSLPVFAALYEGVFSGTTTLEELVTVADGYDVANICDVTVGETSFTVNSRQTIDEGIATSSTALAAYVLNNPTAYFEFGRVMFSAE